MSDRRASASSSRRESKQPKPKLIATLVDKLVQRFKRVRKQRKT